LEAALVHRRAGVQLRTDGFVLGRAVRQQREKVKAASDCSMTETGPESIVVSGVLSSKTNTSSGGLAPFSRLLNACSSPLPFSVASRIRKPWFPCT
jgi:hypothetical protein